MNHETQDQKKLFSLSSVAMALCDRDENTFVAFWVWSKLGEDCEDWVAWSAGALPNSLYFHRRVSCHREHKKTMQSQNQRQCFTRKITLEGRTDGYSTKVWSDAETNECYKWVRHM